MLITKLSPPPRQRPSSLGPTSRHVLGLFVVSFGLLFAVHLGSVITTSAQATLPWQYLVGYGGPITLVSAFFWLIGRLL